MTLIPLLTTIALGYGLGNQYLITDLMYTAMHRDNKDGIACIDCNLYGEGNLEIIIGVIVFIITLYIFLNSLGKLK